MSYLKRSWLLFLVVFLAACGTQTQLPEALVDGETNIEVATGKKLPANFYKKVEGHAPEGAKYKLQLICYAKNNHKKIVLRQTVVLGANNQYKDSGSYSGLSGYSCVVTEIDNKHYDTGDHVQIIVKDAHKTYLDKSYKGGKTVTSHKFKPGNKKLEIIVINKYKKTPAPNEKTKLEFNKFYYDEYGKPVKPDGKSTFYLICKIGHQDKVVDTFYFSKKDGYYYQNKYYRGLDCYLKESFEDSHYELVGVHFAASHNVAGKWHGDYYVSGDFKKDDKGHFVSDRFHIPAKGHLKFIIKDKLKKRVVETPKLKLTVEKLFLTHDKSPVPHDAQVYVDLICSGHKVYTFELSPKSKLKETIHLDKDYAHCVFVEYFHNDHYTLKDVYFVFNGTHTDGAVSDYGTKATSHKFNLKTSDKELYVLIKNVLQKKEKPKLEVVLKKEFKLGYNGHPVSPKPHEFKLQLICGDEVVAETNETYYKTYVDAHKLQGKHCEVKERFVDDHYKAFQYSVAYDDGVKPATTYNDCNTAREDWCEFSRYNVDAKATKLIIVITDNVKEKRQKLELVIKKEFKLGYDGYAANPEHYELEIELICGGTTVAKTDSTYYTAYVYADEVQGKNCELKEKFVDDEYEAVQYSVLYNDGAKQAERTYNNCSNDRCEYSRYDVDAKATKLIIDITNNVKEREVKPHAA